MSPVVHPCRVARALTALSVAVFIGAIAAVAVADTGPLAGDFSGLTADGPRDRSLIVYPPQQLPLIFSHQAHLARGAQCTSCHASATSSQSAIDNLIPTEAACRACHPIDRADPDHVVPGAPPARCGACHPAFSKTVPVARLYVPSPPLKFAHAAHQMTGCTTCHGDFIAGKVDLATVAQLPTMATCLTCHKDGNTAAACTRCHLAERGGLMQTRFDAGDLIPRRDDFGDAHAMGFARDHKQAARQVGAACLACHNQSECVDCHSGTIKPADFHPGDYLLSHPIEARRGSPDCSACHRYESFCVSCHERSNIGPRITTQFNDAEPGKAFHPAGWASPTRTSGLNLHAGEAKKNIQQCASCHRDEDCQKCHSAESGQGNISPHPAGWRGSARCRALDRGDRRMCLRCHIQRNELGCDWSAGGSATRR